MKSRDPRPTTDQTPFFGQDYAKVALAQIPRALTLLDRNPASPTYGCFDRAWWLDRATDFPNALAQYALHGLAMVWAHPLSENPYYRSPALRQWMEGGLSFLVKRAHADGSFDEFYPNERGWSGPSGFLLYSMLSTYELMGVPPESGLGRSIRDVAARCARMHLERTERGTLANHYAMAFLPVAKACRVLGDETLMAPLQRRFEDLLALQDPEGWFREYDGPDPGYLSATVSFLAKMEREGFQHPGLRPAVEKALDFLSYFLWPDNTFGGALGSRQTVHLYPHGFEHFASVFPMAASLAKAARTGFAKGGFVPPAAQSDRYYHYRINELLEASLAARPLEAATPPLPFEKEPFRHLFERSRVLVVKTPNYYAVTNFQKGGVLRAYALPSGKAGVMDSGVEVRLGNGSLAAANWVNPAYETDIREGEAAVRGNLCRIPAKTFSPGRFLVFRLVVILVGAFPFFAERLKGFFRKLLTLGIRPMDIRFERRIRFLEDRIHWTDRLHFGSADVRGLWLGAELPLRYVPQSRHFQKSELDFAPISPAADLMDQAREKGGIEADQSVDFPTLERRTRFQAPEKVEPLKIKDFFRWGPLRIGAGVLAMAVSLTILAVLFARVGAGRVLPLVEQARVGPLALALAMNLIFPFFASLRWRAVLKWCGLEVGFKRATALILASWPLASVTPAKLGSLILIWAFRKQGDRKPALTSLVLERVLDLWVLVGFSILGAFWVYPDWRGRIYLGLTLVLGGVWVLFRMGGCQFLAWCRARGFLLSPPQDSLETITRALGGSLGLWILSMAQWQAVLYSLGVKMDFLDSFLRVPVALLVGMVPVAWMGMGTRDGAFLMVYSGQLPVEKILAASLLFTAIRYLIPGLLGLPWTFSFIRKIANGRQ